MVHVSPGGPAESGGLVAGDIVIEINGTAPDFANDLEMVDYFLLFQPGDTVDFAIRRGESERSLRITPEAMHDDMWMELSAWRMKAKQNLSRGEDIYACDERIAAEESTSRKHTISRGWSHILRQLATKGGALKLTISKSVAGSISIRPDRPDIAPPKLFPEDLGIYRQTAIELESGESFEMTISFNLATQQATITSSRRPIGFNAGK